MLSVHYQNRTVDSKVPSLPNSADTHYCRYFSSTSRSSWTTVTNLCKYSSPRTSLRARSQNRAGALNLCPNTDVRRCADAQSVTFVLTHARGGFMPSTFCPRTFFFLPALLSPPAHKLPGSVTG